MTFISYILGAFFLAALVSLMGGLLMVSGKQRRSEDE